MMTDGEKMYAGTMNLIAGGQVWSYDGSSWTQLAANGIDDPANQMLYPYKWGGTIYVAAESFEPGAVAKNGTVAPTPGPTSGYASRTRGITPRPSP